MQFVLVKHDDGSGYYLFTVPETRHLRFGDHVLLKTRIGQKTGICVCDSFFVHEEDIGKLCLMNGTHRKMLMPVIGTYSYQSWEEEKC